MIEQALDLLL